MFWKLLPGPNKAAVAHSSMDVGLGACAMRGTIHTVIARNVTPLGILSDRIDVMLKVVARDSSAIPVVGFASRQELGAAFGLGDRRSRRGARIPFVLGHDRLFRRRNLRPA
jgi:hypothetical protein